MTRCPERYSNFALDFRIPPNNWKLYDVPRVKTKLKIPMWSNVNAFKQTPTGGWGSPALDAMTSASSSQGDASLPGTFASRSLCTTYNISVILSSTCLASLSLAVWFDFISMRMRVFMCMCYLCVPDLEVCVCECFDGVVGIWIPVCECFVLCICVINSLSFSCVC